MVPQQQFDLAVCTSEELKREVDECRRQMDSMLREREHLLGTVQELTAALAQASEGYADDGQASVQQTHQTHLLELELAIQQGEVFKSRLEQQETEIEELQEKLRQASQQQSPAADLSEQTHQTHLLELELAIQQGEVFKSRLEQQETEIEELQEKLRQASQQQSPASDLSKDPIDVGSSGLPRPPGGELVGVGLAMLQVQKLMMID